MYELNWIMSEGGPLICVEDTLAASWEGVFGLTVTEEGAGTDYDRACEGLPKTLTSAPLKHGAALFFQEPFDTSFWRRPTDGKVFVVQVETCEVDTNIEIIMKNLDESIFRNPIGSMLFSFERSDLIIFDAAEAGSNSDKKTLSFQIGLGKYQILSIFLETREYTLLLHRFDKQK